MKKIVCIDMPFFRGANPEQALAAAVEMINENIEKGCREVVNVETIFEPFFLGLGFKQVGLRVWYRM